MSRRVRKEGTYTMFKTKGAKKEANNKTTKILFASKEKKPKSPKLPKAQKVKKIKSRHIGNKLNAIFTLSLLAMMAIIVGFVSMFNMNLLQNDFQESCNYNINAIIALKDEKIKEAANITSELSSSAPLSSALSSGGPYGYVQAVAPYRKNKAIDVLIVSADGKQVYSSGEAISSALQADFVTQALDGTFNSFVDVINGSNLAAISAVPVYKGSKVVGAIIVSNSLQDQGEIDTLKATSGADYTVFLNDTRMVTTIIVDGVRQNGTTISPDIYNVVNTQGLRYSGKTILMGQHYMVNYEPLLNLQGVVVGSLFSGRNLASVNQQNMTMTIAAAIIGLILFALTDLFLMAFIRRSIVRPLTRIVDFSGQVAGGNLGLSNVMDEEYAYTKDDEIGQVFFAQLETVRALRAYIGEIDRILTDLADGKLATKTQQEYKGDFISIKAALTQVQQKLVDNMTRINEAAAILANSAGEISASSQSLAQGATEQAGSVEELNATIDGVYRNVKSTAEHARTASEKTELVGQEVALGDQRVREMIEAMSEISVASAKIEKINKTIEDIAFQTNILALNAAVEAARAGAAGKGFAVVADEVRNLAGKSAEAARDTTALIQNSLKAITAGSEKAGDTAEVMRHIVSAVNDVVNTIEGISNANEEQAVALGQIQGGMSQIAKVVSTTSASAEESAATAQELTAQAKLLEELVSAFQLN